jgi:type IV secretory pathway VirB2 component (pilin)
MDDGRVVHAGPWPSWPPTKHCSSGCWACRWERTNERQDLAAHLRGPHGATPPRPCRGAAFDCAAAAAGRRAGAAGRAGQRQRQQLAHADRGRAGHGHIVFIIASGLTLVFGLMDVLNFGHGVFIALGAFVATTVMAAWPAFDAPARAQAWWRCSRHAGGHGRRRRLGWAFERVIVRPVYGLHLKQILITMGGMIVGEELIKVIWGPLQIALPLPESLRGSFMVGDAAIEKYRVLAVGIGLLCSWRWPGCWRAPRSAC